MQNDIQSGTAMPPEAQAARNATTKSYERGIRMPMRSPRWSLSIKSNGRLSTITSVKGYTGSRLTYGLLSAAWSVDARLESTEHM